MPWKWFIFIFLASTYRLEFKEQEQQKLQAGAGQHSSTCIFVSVVSAYLYSPILDVLDTSFSCRPPAGLYGHQQHSSWKQTSSLMIHFLLVLSSFPRFCHRLHEASPGPQPLTGDSAHPAAKSLLGNFLHGPELKRTKSEQRSPSE